jgi:6-phosphogluconolactonase
MTNKLIWPLVCILALLTIVCACGSGSSNATPPPPNPDFLYALTLSGPPPNLSFQLSSLRVNSSTGALGSPSTTTFGSQLVPGIAVEPNSKYLYASYPNPLSNAIGIFTIDPSTGVPTQTSVFSLNVICPFCLPPSGPGELTLSPSGKFLYYASSSLGGGVSQGIGALAVDSAAGTLTFVTGSPFPADQAPFIVRVHPSGQFLYTENLDASGADFIDLQSLSGFSVDASTGALAPVPGSPFVPPVSATIGGLAIHPSGKFLYATSGMEANGILAWNIDGTTGGLTVLAGSPFQIGVAIYSAAFDPSGKFLYATAGPMGGLLGFNVDPNSGALTPIPGSPFSSGSFLGGPTVEPSGHFLFAGDQPNHTIVGFSIDSATGALAALGNPAPLSARPVSLTIVKVP